MISSYVNGCTEYCMCVCFPTESSFLWMMVKSGIEQLDWESALDDG